MKKEARSPAGRREAWVLRRKGKTSGKEGGPSPAEGSRKVATQRGGPAADRDCALVVLSFT